MNPTREQDKEQVATPAEGAPDISALVGRLKEWIGVPKNRRWPTRSLDDDIREGADALAEMSRLASKFNIECQHAQSRAYKAEEALAALQSELDKVRKDSERLDWFDSHYFMAYKSDIATHCVLVNERINPRKGIVKKTLRDCLDSAIESARKGGERG